jgi:hypothetical protein
MIDPYSQIAQAAFKNLKLSRRYCLPLIAIPMPLTKDGRGPANPDETHETVYQVWDAACQTVCEFADEESAKYFAYFLNQGV